MLSSTSSSSSSSDLTQLLPVTFALAAALVACIIFLAVFFTLNRKRGKNQGKYSVSDDKKIIKVNDDDDVITITTECEDHTEHLKSVFPHLISVPKSEDILLPGPGLVGLGFN